MCISLTIMNLGKIFSRNLSCYIFNNNLSHNFLIQLHYLGNHSRKWLYEIWDPKILENSLFLQNYLKDYYVTFRPFPILEIDLMLSKFSILGPKPIFHNFSIHIHMHRNQCGSWQSRNCCEFELRHYLFPKHKSIRLGCISTYVEVFKQYFEEKALLYLPRNISMYESPKLVQACWCRHNYWRNVVWCRKVNVGARLLCIHIGISRSIPSYQNQHH